MITRKHVPSTIAHARTWVCLLLLLVSPASAFADIMLTGDPIPIASSGAFAPAVAYNPASDQFLVLWRDVLEPNPGDTVAVRIDADTGTVLGDLIYLSDDLGTVKAITPAATYNPVNEEWFVVYQASLNGGEDDVFAQRFSKDGVKVDDHIELVKRDGFQNAAHVACRGVDGSYFVVWKERMDDVLHIHGRLFDMNGTAIGLEVVLSDPGIRNKYMPKVAYNPLDDEFMVVWSDYRNMPVDWDPDIHGNDNKYKDIYGRRVGSTGWPVGPNLPIYAPDDPVNFPDGQDAAWEIACNPSDGRYYVAFNKLQPGKPITPKSGGLVAGSLLSDLQGSPIGEAFSVSCATPSFGSCPVYPGCLSCGAGCYDPPDEDCCGSCPGNAAVTGFAYSPHHNSYLVTYEDMPTQTITGQELSASGVRIDVEEVIVPNPGGIRDGVLAVRPRDGLYLQVSVSDGGVVKAQRFTTAPVPPVIRGVTPDPDLAIIPGEYTEQLILDQGTGPVSWSVVQGPAGRQVDGNGLVSWTPSGLDVGQLATFEIRATNALESSTESWQVLVEAMADLDHDHDVDQSDYGLLQTCLSGPGVPYASGCGSADFTADGAVDGEDLEIFMDGLSGENQPPGC